MAVLLTDSALQLSLLLTKETQCTEGNERVFKPTDTFDKSGDVQDGNIFETLYDIEDLESYGNGDDSEDTKSVADKLIETIRNNFSDDPLFIFNEDTIKQLNELNESLSLNQCNPDAVVNTNIVSMIHEKSSNLKFTHDANRTGKLWIQFMDFSSIARMSIQAERNGDWKLHIHASEQMLLFFAAAGRNNYLTSVLLYLPDIKNLCTCLKSKYETVGLFTI